MNQIIPISENERIKIEPLNWIIQRRRISKRKEAWRSEEFYPDAASLVSDYLNKAPARAERAIASLEELIQTIKQAEIKIREVIINYQKNGRDKR